MTAMRVVGGHAARLTGVALILVVGWLARTPQPSAEARRELASRFHFTRVSLPDASTRPHRNVRAVNASLRGIEGWISSVGAAVAVHDLDGDGVVNDVVSVDPRTDDITVAPVPGTGARFAAFVLDPSPLAYDRSTMAPMGCLPGDFNQDGRTDLLVYFWGRTPLVFLQRAAGAGRAAVLGPASFEPCETVAEPQRWFTNAATLADLDGDGRLDVYVGNYFPDGARILDAAATNREHMQLSMSRASNGGRDHVLLGTGCEAPGDASVPFREAAAGLPREVAEGWTLAVGAADLDGDLLPEVYVGNDFGPDRLLVNRSTPGHLAFSLATGRKGFTTPNSKVLGHDSFKGMGVDFGDVNGDGQLDLYVSNISNEFALLESHFLYLSAGPPALLKAGIAPFRDASEPLGVSRSGWSWDCRLADFDNDGTLEAVQATGFLRGRENRWPELQELAMGNDNLLADPRMWPRFASGDDLSGHQHNAFFVRGRNGRFVDVAPDVGLSEREVARGLATADVDGDGDLDLLVANQWAPSSCFRNDLPHPASFLALDLLLPVRGATPALTVSDGAPSAGAPCRFAVGAEAQVTLPDGRVLLAQVDGGNGHSGKRGPELHFGLGSLPADARLPVRLRWRDREGHTHEARLQLSAGRHTVMLGGSVPGSES